MAAAAERGTRAAGCAGRPSGWCARPRPLLAPRSSPRSTSCRRACRRTPRCSSATRRWCGGSLPGGEVASLRSSRRARLSSIDRAPASFTTLRLRVQRRVQVFVNPGPGAYAKVAAKLESLEPCNRCGSRNASATHAAQQPACMLSSCHSIIVESRGLPTEWGRRPHRLPAAATCRKSAAPLLLSPEGEEGRGGTNHPRATRDPALPRAPPHPPVSALQRQGPHRLRHDPAGRGAGPHRRRPDSAGEHARTHKPPATPPSAPSTAQPASHRRQQPAAHARNSAGACARGAALLVGCGRWSPRAATRALGWRTWRRQRGTSWCSPCPTP